MEVITGVTTDEAFRKAITDRGAELSNQATPLSLATAINSVGGTVDFESTNEDVIYAVNTEIVPVTFKIGFEYFTIPELQIGDSIRITNADLVFPEKYFLLLGNQYSLKEDAPASMLVEDCVVPKANMIIEDNVLVFAPTQEIEQIIIDNGGVLTGLRFRLSADEGLLENEDGELSEAISLDFKHGEEIK